MPRRSILSLSPQLYGFPGGVQSYMRRLREILGAYSREKGVDYHCLSLMDTLEQKDQHPNSIQTGTFEGCSGNKFAFVAKAILSSISRHSGFVVVGHLGQVPVALALKKLRLIDSYILVLHGIEAWTKVDLLDRYGALEAEYIVATTNFTGHEFCVRNNIPQSKIRVIPLGLAKREIAEPTPEDFNHCGLNILTVGRLSGGDRLKGTDILIKAFHRALASGINARLIIVGEGDDMPRLRELVSALKLDKSVLFLGSVSDIELTQIYKKCDVFAMPSKKEGFGIVFLEAMWHAKPCIGGNHGGTPEVIDHGVNGYLVEHGDTEALAKHIVEFTQKPELRKSMGLCAYEKVKENYLFDNMRDNWFALLEGLVDSYEGAH